MSTADYTGKHERYFHHARREIEPLLPAHAGQVLEVGCGSGATLAWLKNSGRCTRTTGIEIYEAVAEQARARVDELHVGDAESLVAQTFIPESFDMVLCLDVLEHLVDPWAFVGRVRLLPTNQVSAAGLAEAPVFAPLAPPRLASRQPSDRAAPGR